MEKMKLRMLKKNNVKLSPKVVKNDGKYLVILENLNIWGEGNDITEAYNNYEKKIDKAEIENIDTNKNSQLFNEITWRKRRNIFLIILFVFGFTYAQIAVVYALAYKFYNISSVINLLNTIDKKISAINVEDKIKLKNSIKNLSINLNEIINK